MVQTHTEHTLFKELRTPHFFRRLIVAVLACVCVCGGVWGADKKYTTVPKLQVETLTWSEKSSWESNTVPGTFGDSDTITVNLNGNMKYSGEKFEIGGSAVVTFNLNGFNMEITGEFNQNNCGDGEKSGIVNIVGPGTFMVNGYDPNGSGTSYVYLSKGATMIVKEYMFTNKTPLIIKDTDNSCSLYLPSGGQNINYGAAELEQIPDNLAAPYSETKEPTYKYSSERNTPEGTETLHYTLRFQNIGKGNENSVTIKYKWEITNKGSNPEFKINGKSISEISVDEGYAKYAFTKNGSLVITSSSNLSVDEGIKITVRTPDDKMDLGVFEYIEKKWTWSGADSVDGSDWVKRDNWNFNGSDEDRGSDYPPASASISISSGCANYPEIKSGQTISIHNVTIMPGAHISQSGGTFSVDELMVEGSGSYQATGGTVRFTSSSPFWRCDYPVNSKLPDVTIPAGTNLVLNTDMYIAGNLTVENGGVFDGQTKQKTLFVQPSGTSTLSGTTTSIKLEKLTASTTTSGKILNINGSLSTNEISIKGTINALITVAGETGSKIQLGKNCGTGEYIMFASNTVPAISGEKTYTVEKSIPYMSGEVPSGWIYNKPTSAVWNGSVSDKWTTLENWTPAQSPSGNISIPAGCPHDPKLDDNITITTAIIQIAEGASLDCGGKKLEAFSVTNSGTLSIGTGMLNVSDLTLKTDSGISITTGTIQASSTLTNQAALTLNNGKIYTNNLINDTDGTMTVESGVTMNLSAFTNRGTLKVPNGVTLPGQKVNGTGSLVEYTAANPTLSWGDVYEKVKFDSSLTVGAGKSWSITQAKEITFADAVTNAGTMALTADEITFEKSVTNSSTGTLALQAGTTTFSGGLTNQKTLSSSGNLIFTAGVDSSQGAISCTGEIHLSGTSAQNVTISTTSTIGEVVVDAGAQPTLTGNLTCGGLTIEATGSLDISNKVLTVTGDLTNSGTLTAASGTIGFSGAGAHSFTSDSAISAGTLSLAAPVTVAVTGGASFGTLTFSSGGSVSTSDSSSYTVTGSVSGAGDISGGTAKWTFTENFSGTGTLSSAADGEMTFVKGFSNTGTIALAGTTTFSGGSAQFITAGTTPQFADVTVSGAGGISLQSDCTFAKLTVTNGSIALNSHTLTVTGDWTHGAGNITAASGGKAVCNGTMTVSSSVAIAGNNTWNNLTCTTAGTTITFAGGSTQTFNGILKVTGTSASPVALVSSDTATPWILAMGSPPSTTNLKLSYVTVSYSTASPDISKIIDVDESTVSEGTAETTTGWFKVITTYTWDNASGDGNWTNKANWKKGVGRAPSAPSATNTELEIIIDADMTLAQNVQVQKFTVRVGKTVALGTSTISATTMSVAGTLSTDGSTAGQWPAGTTWGEDGTGTVEYTGTNGVVFTDDVAFQNLTCMAAKTFTVTGGKTLTVQGTLKLSGVTLTSSDTNNWNLTMGQTPSATNLQLSNVKISYSTASPAVSAVTDADGSTVTEGTYGTTDGWFGTEYTYAAGAWLRGTRTGVSAPPASDARLTVIIDDDYTLPGNVTYGGFTVQAAKKLTLGNNTVTAGTITVQGTVITNGTTQNQLTATGAAGMVWESASASEYAGTAADARDYLTGAATRRVQKTGGTFTFGNGLSVAAGQTVNLESGTVSVAGNVSIATSGTLITGNSGNPVLLTVTGNWTNSGTFTAGTNSTVTFAPAAPAKTATISGNNTWYNLICTTAGSTLQFEAGKTQTVQGRMTIDGQVEGSEIKLISGTAGTQWILNIAISGVDIQYTGVSDGKSVINISSATHNRNNLDIGGNTNWFYTVLPGTTFGVSYAFAAYGEKELYVAFEARIDTSNLADIPAALSLVQATGTAINAAVRAKVVQDSADGTVVQLTLTNPVTVGHIESGRVTATSENGNITEKGSTRILDPTVDVALLPLVVQLVTPTLATQATDAGQHTIRLFDGSGTAANAVLADEDFILQSKSAETVSYTLMITQDNGWKSRKTPKDMASWLATVTTALPAGQIISADGSPSGKTANFTVPASLNLAKSSPVHFFYGLDRTNAAGEQIFVIRSPSGNPMESLSLWSVKLSEVDRQEGGVTIRNNVINVLAGEETIIEVDMKERGSLTIQILTADGNVVTTLQRGTKSAGRYTFTWNGTNKNGAAVARGIYFVQVQGKDIAQTRKVMVVRE